MHTRNSRKRDSKADPTSEEREGNKNRDPDIETGRQRDRQTETERERLTETERYRETQRETERRKERNRKRERESGERIRNTEILFNKAIAPFEGV